MYAHSFLVKAAGWGAETPLRVTNSTRGFRSSLVWVSDNSVDSYRDCFASIWTDFVSDGFFMSSLAER